MWKMGKEGLKGGIFWWRELSSWMLNILEDNWEKVMNWEGDNIHR